MRSKIRIQPLKLLLTVYWNHGKSDECLRRWPLPGVPVVLRTRVLDKVRDPVWVPIWGQVRELIWKRAGGRRRVVFPYFNRKGAAAEISLTEIARRRFNI